MFTQQSERTSSRRNLPGFSELTERFGLLFAGDKIAIPEELKKQVVDALHFGHSDSTKTLAESNIFWWSGKR